LAGANVTIGSELDAISSVKDIEIAIELSQRIKVVFVQGVLGHFVENFPIVGYPSRQKVVIGQKRIESAIGHGWDGCTTKKQKHIETTVDKSNCV
jgi:hypothetical protein